jgi:arabinan endo-1,5-alpha-L-arabinosidase
MTDSPPEFIGRIIAAALAVLPILLTGCTEKAAVLPYSGFRPLGDDTIAADSSLWGELNVHDPSVIKDGDYYYVFSTDASNGNRHPLGVQIRRSKDLVTWEYRGAAFRDFKNDCAEPIAYAGLWLPNHDGLWAPDIVKSGGRYRLYFSASTFGSQKSCIALAESKNIEGPYTYKGIVVKSISGPGPNAIDPAIVRSKEGGLYMAYGSFFGGIWLAELDGKTGFFRYAAEPVKIAGGDHAAVEGSAIVYLGETDYYYLFVSLWFTVEGLQYKGCPFPAHRQPLPGRTGPGFTSNCFSTENPMTVLSLASQRQRKAAGIMRKRVSMPSVS